MSTEVDDFVDGLVKEMDDPKTPKTFKVQTCVTYTDPDTLKRLHTASARMRLALAGIRVTFKVDGTEATLTKGCVS